MSEKVLSWGCIARTGSEYIKYFVQYYPVLGQKTACDQAAHILVKDQLPILLLYSELVTRSASIEERGAYDPLFTSTMLHSSLLFYDSDMSE